MIELRKQPRNAARLLIGVFAFSLSGCLQPFIYTPPPAANGPHFPYSVAVMGFDDGTEDFVQTGGHAFSPFAFNLVKGGGKSVGIPQLSPDTWTKAFADDLQQSGMFDQVTALFSSAALSHENLIIHGTILRATLAMHTIPCEFSLKLTANVANQSAPIWEGEFTQKKPLQLSSCPTQTCGLEDINQFLETSFQQLFADARHSLGEKLKAMAASPPSPATP